MKINKISKKILAVVLCSTFVLTTSGTINIFDKNNLSRVYAESEKTKSDVEEKKVENENVTSDYDMIDNLTNIQTNTGKELGIDFVNGEAKIKLSGYRINSKKSGYLLIDLKKDYVKGYSSKYFSDKRGDDYVDDAMRITTNFSSEPTIIEKDFCSYNADKSGYVRFYVPYDNATGEMTVTFSIPQSVQNKINEEISKSKEKFAKFLENELKKSKPDYGRITSEKAKMINENRMEPIIYSEDVEVEDLLTRQNGELIYDGNKPKSGFVNLDTYTKNEDEKIYKGFVFDSEHKIIRIKPNTNGKKIRLYLGAGKDKGFYFKPQNNNKVEFDIKFYRDGSIYRKVNDGKVHEKDDFKDSEYKRYFMNLSNGFNSLDIPVDTFDGIIEIKLNGANNFLLNLKLQDLTDYRVSDSVGTKPSDTENEVVNEKIDSKVDRISGNNRYETAIKLSQKSFNESKIAVVASGENFADALAGGALASAKEAPLLLVNNSNSEINNVNKELRRLGVEKVYVLGGKSSISVSTEMKITNDKDDSDKRREVVRLSGDNRYETSYEIYKETTRTSGVKESPILVNGQNFADALSAGALSANLKRGIVLTDGHNVNSKINKKSSDNIVIGGYASMDSSFGGKRISGANRYETSVNVAEYFHNPKNVMLASGEKYPDGLASISLYKKYEGPLLLTPTNTLPKETKKYIKNNDIEDVYIIGGTNSVSSKIENMFK